MKTGKSGNGLAGKTAGVIVISVALSIAGTARSDGPETERCVEGLSADRKPTQEGTCTLVFRMGSDIAYSARLEQAMIVVNGREYELEIDHGSVRGISDKLHPNFIVRGSKHFARIDIEDKGTIWVFDTPEGKMATVKSESGVVLLTTSWGDQRHLGPNESQIIKLEAPESVEPTNCAIRWTGRAPNNGDMWLAIAALLVMITIQRSKRRS